MWPCFPRDPGTSESDFPSYSDFSHCTSAACGRGVVLLADAQASRPGRVIVCTRGPSEVLLSGLKIAPVSPVKTSAASSTTAHRRPNQNGAGLSGVRDRRGTQAREKLASKAKAGRDRKRGTYPEPDRVDRSFRNRHSQSPHSTCESSGGFTSLPHAKTTGVGRAVNGDILPPSVLEFQQHIFAAARPLRKGGRCRWTIDQ